MFLSVIKQFNWVDIFVLILLIRISYVAIKNGFIVEVFKLLGVILAVYISMHYYTTLSDYVEARVKIEGLPLEFLDFICFVFLAFLGYLIFVVIRIALGQLIKTEAVPTLHKWGGLILGIARGILSSGLIVFILVISSVGYLRNSVSASYLGKRLFNIGPATYTKIWEGFASKFMAKEKFNNVILEVQKNFGQ